MATVIPFDRAFDVEPHRAYELSPLLRRITCGNPSLFTFKGTNTYLVGRGRVAVVDPGPVSEDQCRSILDATKGEEIGWIVATHTHHDHSPGIAALKAATGAPTYGYGPHGIGAMTDWPFPATEGGDRTFQPDVRLGDGERIEGDGWSMEAVFTPGHISNHLCFAIPEENALLSGDHVMGWSTSIVSPPDGDMADYMDSLNKLLSRTETVYYPGHGGPVRDPIPYVRAFIAHREEREAQILDCLKRGQMPVGRMVEIMYADVDPALHRAAARSVLSHLIRMCGDGRVAVVGARVSPDAEYRLP